MKSTAPKILSVGLAVPETAFTQKQIASILNIKSDKGLRFFDHPHIQKRHLSLPEALSTQRSPQPETNSQLLARFKRESLIISKKAITSCLAKVGKGIGDVDMICCVTSTGFLVPALSALLVEELGMNKECQRFDIVGMGCNAGLNGLNAVSSWCQANPGLNALLICCEVCSAIYSTDDSEESALVNSLFGDGAAAILVNTDRQKVEGPVAEVLGFSSYMIPRTLDLLRFDWKSEENRYCFVVDKKTPATIASQIEIPVQHLLKKMGIDKTQVKHWVVHSGGEAILQGVQKSLHLSDDKLKHTRSVLRDYGNLSSGSFLFSYARLLESKTVQDQELGLMMTMGPGLTVEVAGIRLVNFGK